MVLEIKSVRPHSKTHGFINLVDEESESDYASWPFHVDGEDGDISEFPNVWKWENPEEPVENITLSPSLVYDGEIGPDFHVYIKDGEIEHLNDCQCGC